MASLTSLPTAPWDSTELAAARSPGSSHSWWVGPGFSPVAFESENLLAAYGITYELDEARSPFGVMRFMMPAEPGDGGWSEATSWLSPHQYLLPIHLRAGYLARPLAFSGWVTDRRRIVKDGQNGYSIELTTGEDLVDVPLLSDYSIPDSYTGMAAVLGDFWDSSEGDLTDAWPPVGWYATLPAPSAAQLATFRALDFAAGDSIGDMLRTCAAALGQKIHGDHRHGYPVGADQGDVIMAVRPQYVFSSAVAARVSPTEWMSYDRDENIDDYATKVKLTAQWMSSGDLKSSTYIYNSPAEWSNLQRIVQKDITVQMRPELSGGVRKLTSTNPLGKAYAAAFFRRTWQVTVTMRAWWWLEPGASLIIEGPDGQVDSGIVSRVSVDVDAGTMTVTLRPA